VFFAGLGGRVFDDNHRLVEDRRWRGCPSLTGYLPYNADLEALRSTVEI
jgi:hypothetical protein